MDAPPKAPPVYKPTPQRLAAPSVYRPYPINAPSAQLKPANNFRLETRPAPAAYRPAQVQSQVQPKAVNPFRLETRSAPAVFRPSVSREMQPHANPRLPNVQSPRAGNPFARRAPLIQHLNPGGSIQRMRRMVEFPRQEGTPIARLNNKIFEISGPQVTERGFFTSLSVKQKADALFAEFLSMGLGYDLGTSMSGSVLGNMSFSTPLKPGEEMRKAFGGNCQAMAEALAEVLIMVDIPAEARQVRPEVKGKAFVVYAPNFVDKQITGNVYRQKVLWSHRYLFTNHTATWVPSLKIFYDLMAGTTYQSLTPLIEIELTQVDDSGDIFEGQYQGWEWRLTRRRDILLEGGFYGFDMEPLPRVVFNQDYNPTAEDSYRTNTLDSLAWPPGWNSGSSGTSKKVGPVIL